MSDLGNWKVFGRLALMTRLPYPKCTLAITNWRVCHLTTVMLC